MNFQSSIMASLKEIRRIKNKLVLNDQDIKVLAEDTRERFYGKGGAGR